MSIISQWLSDPLGYLIDLIKLIPAILPALIFHEVAHGYVAYRLGDPTAKSMGRLSLNPIRHLDLWGTIFMFVIGLGWAKPVPVDPRYFRHPRRDILLVSIAGIVTNLMMFTVGCVLMYGMVFFALSCVPQNMWIAEGLITEQTLSTVYYIPASDIFRYAYGMEELLIAPYLGQTWRVIFEIVSQFTTLNLCLALFNLIPMPPLDGYRLLGTLLPNGSPFTTRKVADICRLIMMVLAFTGILSKGLSHLIEFFMSGIGSVVMLLSGF